MQLDVDIEPTFRFTYIKCTDKQKDITMKQCSKLFKITFRPQDGQPNFTKSKRIYVGETIFFLKV